MYPWWYASLSQSCSSEVITYQVGLLLFVRNAFSLKFSYDSACWVSCMIPETVTSESFSCLNLLPLSFKFNLFLFLFYIFLRFSFLVCSCSTLLKTEELPPPKNLNFIWETPFRLSLTWEKPEDLDPYCKVNYTVNVHQSQVSHCHSSKNVRSVDTESELLIPHSFLAIAHLLRFYKCQMIVIIFLNII